MQVNLVITRRKSVYVGFVSIYHVFQHFSWLVAYLVVRTKVYTQAPVACWAVCCEHMYTSSWQTTLVNLIFKACLNINLYCAGCLRAPRQL